MILCIDTISIVAGIALVRSGLGSQTICHYHVLHPKEASEKILVTIDEVLREAGTSTKDITGVLVIKGPGSFTGLRVGISVANQFSHQLNIPIVGLRTDEWWFHRTEEKNFAYLQTLNVEEVYEMQYVNGKETFYDIIPVDQLQGNRRWLGQVTDEQRAVLPSSFHEIKSLMSPEEVWIRAVQGTVFRKKAIYDLVEPFYGKEAKITAKKNKN